MAFDPEFGLGTPDATQGPGQFDWTGPASGSEQVVLAFDLTLPASPPTQGMIFEQGGGGRGTLIIVRQGYMRFRFGDGGGFDYPVPTQAYGTQSGNSYIWDVPIASLPFDGGTHTIVMEIEPRNNGNTGMRGWCDGVELFDISGLGAVSNNQWSGSASGGFLTHQTNITGDSNYDANWPVQSGQARMYLNTLVTAVPSTGVQAKRWNGASWDNVTLRGWDGAQWTAAKFWDASSWLEQV